MAGGGVTDPVPWMPGDTLFEQAALSALLHWDPIKFAMNERIRVRLCVCAWWMRLDSRSAQLRVSLRHDHASPKSSIASNATE